MYHARERIEMLTEFLIGKPKGEILLERLGVIGRIILKLILNR
jgi:hypothetical protein